ncbi:MAG TPA: carbamoyltransferase HypF [Terriglobales bacterium]|jgi:hydrogenase maturation protein HypF|nr:carbamoyltransferase HypF [Terriglobales bacterium]
MAVRRAIAVSGIVQGVGFRPYIYRLASERGLAGWVTNTSAGVSIEVQGAPAVVDDFVDRLPAEAPPLSRIIDVSVREVPPNGDRDFQILLSHQGESMQTLISPDVALCPDCLRELFDPRNRRYRYPFINCTNCGPRFTIVRGIPYDRPRTSMAVFPMCPACQAEYDDPRDRRFHAQPNACWQCGPHVELWDRSGNAIERREPIAEAAARLHAGEVVAVKGLGGFHLACDATNPAAVDLLRRRKRRVEKPFAVMAPDLVGIERFCEVDDAARRVLEQVERPIVLLPKKQPNAIAEQVAPRNRYLGVFLPYTPLHYLLLAEGGFPALVMTSGNLSEEPIAIDNREAVARLGELADCLLVHNRDILLRCDDSVVRVSGGRARQMRRSRGYVPVPVFLKDELPPILAVGGELKNTLCLTRGRHAFLSQHIGDLENLESYKFFEEAVEHLERILEVEPRIVACDLHPDYFSTKWASQQKGVHLIGVQHHHAHIAGCMAENHLDGRVIGFALDGTGYGSDGRIWGGEVLVADYAGFERAAHFAYVPLPGGAAAIREPWRMAVSYLAHHFGRDFLRLRIPFVQRLDRRKVEVVLRMMEQQVNSPLTSSCGRLFDAVAALAGVRAEVNYEAQAAIELEMAMLEADAGDATAYPFELLPQDEGWTIGSAPMFGAMVEDVKHNQPISIISRRFHNGVVEVLLELARRLRRQHSLDRICLSGGTFQNFYLVEQLSSRLEADGFQVFTHSQVPAGDGGLSLGQALVAARRATATL